MMTAKELREIYRSRLERLVTRDLELYRLGLSRRFAPDTRFTARMVNQYERQA